MSLASPSRLGAYEILAPLGVGGMGEVYRARDLRLNREVAIKVLPDHLATDPEAARRFEREAKAVAALSHPNIVSLFDFGAEGDVRYVVTELLEGSTLREAGAGSPLPLRKVLDYGRQLCLGIAAAHEKGIVHRDLKPENLFLTHDGRIKILDFGLAKHGVPAAGDGDSAPTMAQTTEPGLVLGTVGYMAPEQVRGRAVDHRTDIFAIGTVLFELMAGRAAFRRDSAVETMSAILRDDPFEALDSGSFASPLLTQTIRRCIEKSPTERFQSARDLGFALETLSNASGAPIGSVGPGLAEPRRKALLAPGLQLALVALLSAALGGLVSYRRPSEPPVFRRVSFRNGALGAARFGPDGRALFYSAAWDGDGSRLFAGSLDSPDSRPLGEETAELAAVSSSGELAILLQRGNRTVLARMPSAGGAPRDVLEQVLHADWSPSGDELAVVRFVQGQYRIEYPIGKTLLETTSRIGQLRVSPTGDAIAYLEYPDQSLSGSVALVDRRGERTTLSTFWQSLIGLAWSGSGDEVLFTAAKHGRLRAVHGVTRAGRLRTLVRSPGRLTLQDVAADGSLLLAQPHPRQRIRVQSSAAHGERDLAWLDFSVLDALSRDGKFVLLTEAGEAGGEEFSVFLRPTDGAPAVRLGAGGGMALSPDGKWALASFRNPPRLQLLPTGAGAIRELRFEGERPESPAGFLEDGKRIFYAAEIPGQKRRTFLQDLESGVARPITPPGVIGTAVSPDGNWIAAGDRQLYPLGEGRPLPILGLEPSDQVVGWAQDGRSLLVVRRGENEFEIRRVDPAYGKSLRIRQATVPDFAGSFRVQNVEVTPDGNAYAYGISSETADLYVASGVK